MKTFKGFNRDMTCRGFQYEEGKEYSTDQKPIRCGNVGFHSCETPLDLFSYYEPTTSVYHEVETDGEVDRGSDDSKIATSKIKIGARLSITALCKAAFDFVFEHCDKSKENRATGNSSASLSIGAGSSAEIKNTDEIHSANAVAIATGPNGKVRAPLGCWIVCAEWDGEGEKMLGLKSARIDGKKLTADTWYTVKGGKWEKV